MKRGQILLAAQRLRLYAERVEAHLHFRDSRNDLEALVDIAEAGEIARRLYDAILMASKQEKLL